MASHRLSSSTSIKRSFPFTKNGFSEVKDLQLAAEIGKSLLEQNEALENEIKAQQAIIDDQSQEIEYLTKQVGSMREENLNRTKFYEQLEVNLYDLENTNVDLSRKREMDKKRIQSMCENIDYLEKKCEELNGTLECLRTSNKKRRNLINNDSYYSYSSHSESSSEDDNSLMQINRRRSQSLQDLRDYYPPSDEFDSGNHSNSPDPELNVKSTADLDFIQTLEFRIEELIQSKKKETAKLRHLEARLEALIKENALLQKQIIKLTAEKNKLFAQSLAPTVGASGSPFPKVVKFKKLTVTPSSNSSTKKSKPKTNTPDNQICSRCSTELNVRSLVNSIEFENDDYHSLEYELARANEQSANESSGSEPNSIDESASSTESSPKHAASSADSSSVDPVLVPIKPNLHEFEQGFLDYFFGTNSILRKIHKRRRDPTSLTNSAFQNQTPNHSISEQFKSIDYNNYDEIEQLHSLLLVEDLEEDEEDSCLLKDIGIENFAKDNRKIKLPNPKSISPIPNNSFDERVLSDIGSVKNVQAKSRGILWWLLWVILMFFGTIRFGCQVTRLIIGFFFSLILPRRRTNPAALIESSSIFYPNEFSFRNKKLPIKIS